MPTYLYEDCQGEEFELNVPMDERDNIPCGPCGNLLKRKIAFTGLAWSPTRNGGYS